MIIHTPEHRDNKLRKFTDKLIAVVCVMSMLVAACLGGPARTLGSEDITLSNAPEKDFTAWTFSDLGIQDQTVTGDLNWTKPAAGTANLDKTIFHGKIMFPDGGNIGNFYIGGSPDTTVSTYSGFLIRGNTDGSHSLDLSFQPSGQNPVKIAYLYPDTAGTTIRGNDELIFSMSVEYLSESAGKVSAKIGVFLDGKLYNNTYFTANNLEAAALTRFIKWKAPAGNPVVSSYPEAEAPAQITLENAPEKDFTAWTFRDLGIQDQTVTGDLNWTKPAAGVASLDRTIFHGKIMFPDGGSFGNFFIGGSPDTTVSTYSGFLIRGNTDGSHSLDLSFEPSGQNPVKIANLYPDTAGTTIRGNAELIFSMSVEYLSVSSGKVTAKIGVFFDGKLYNNTYFTASNLEAAALTRFIKWKSPAGSPVVKSYPDQSSSGEDITLENAPEKDFTAWTFRDLNIDDQTVTEDLNWAKPASTVSNLDRTIFHGTIMFPDDGSFGNFYIGGSPDKSASFYSGFLIRGNTDGSHSLDLSFQPSGQNPVKITYLYPDTAGTTIRGNEELLFSMSVEYLSESGGKVTARIGVFLDGKLYNNTYFTVGDLEAAALTRFFKWKFPAGNPVVKSYPEMEAPEQITLENAPEKDFTAWTFRDLDIEDQTVTEDLNWTKPAVNIPNLDKTIFHGIIMFPDGGSFGNFCIGGSPDTTVSTYSGFLIRGNTDGSHSLDLSFHPSGQTPIKITYLYPDAAGTAVRGNEELLFSMSVEYLSESEGSVTAKIGVFLDGKLYNNKYFTVSDLEAAALTRFVKWKAPAGNPIVKSYPDAPEPQDIYLDEVPEKDFACWTFDDLGINDQYLSVHLNWEDDWKENTLGNSLDHTIFNGLIHFPADTENFGNFYIGGAGENDASKWRGFFFTANGTTDELCLGFAGTDGNLFNKYGNTQSSAMKGILSKFTPDKAGTTLRGNASLQVSLSVEYTAETDDTADLKIGVFFDGKLYGGEYLTISQAPKDFLRQNVRYYAIGPNNGIFSQHLCGKKTSAITPRSSYEELTLRDFSIIDSKATKIEGSDFRLSNYRDYDSLDGRAVSVVCSFPEDGAARFSIGGTFWRGVYLGTGNDGRMELCYVNAEGGLLRMDYIDAAKAGVSSLTGRSVTYRLTFDIKEGSGGKSELCVGLYINGKLYGGKHYTVHGADTETLTGTFKVYVVKAPFAISSVSRTPDLSIYGFSNESWKKRI